MRILFGGLDAWDNRDLWFRLALPRELVGLPFPHIHHECRPKTRQARSTVASYARVDYAKRAGIEQTLCQTLRGHVAVWREAIGKLLVLADVVQFRTKISQIVVVCALLLLEPVHLRELDGLVERDFSLRRL